MITVPTTRRAIRRLSYIACGKCIIARACARATRTDTQESSGTRVRFRGKHYAGITAQLQNRRVRGEVSSFVYENKIYRATSPPANRSLI